MASKAGGGEGGTERHQGFWPGSSDLCWGSLCANGGVEAFLERGQGPGEGLFPTGR